MNAVSDMINTSEKVGGTEIFYFIICNCESNRKMNQYALNSDFSEPKQEKHGCQTFCVLAGLSDFPAAALNTGNNTEKCDRVSKKVGYCYGLCYTPCRTRKETETASPARPGEAYGRR